jgi:hypothetical protein
MALLRYPAYRFTGKALTPHVVRRMFATHVARTPGLSSAERENLGHSMVSRFQSADQQLSPALALSQEDSQWAAEIAQAFLDEQAKGASQP